MRNLALYLLLAPIVLLAFAAVAVLAFEWFVSAQEAYRIARRTRPAITALLVAAVTPVVHFHRAGMARVQAAERARAVGRARCKANHPAGTRLQMQPEARLRLIQGGGVDSAARYSSVRDDHPA